MIDCHVTIPLLDYYAFKPPTNFIKCVKYVLKYKIRTSSGCFKDFAEINLLMNVIYHMGLVLNVVSPF